MYLPNFGAINLFTISGIIISLACFPLSVFIIKNAERDIKKWLVALFTIAVGIWGLGDIFISLEQNAEQSLLWWRLTYIGVIMIPIFLLHFAIVFLNKDKYKFLIYLSYLFGIFLQLTNLTGIMLNKVTYVFDQFYYSTPSTIFNPLFAVYFVAVVFLVNYWLVKDFLSAEGIKRKQIQYILLGTSLGFAGGTLSFLPAFYINFYPFLNFTAVFFPIFTAIGVLRYQLIGLKVFIRKNVFYLLTGFLLIGVYWLAVLTFRYLGSGQVSWPQLGFPQFPQMDLRQWYFPLSALVNVIASIGLGLLLLFKDFRSKVNRLFFAFCLSVAIWSGCYFIWQLSTTYESALFWSRGLMFGAIFTAPFYLHLVLEFVGVEEKYKKFLWLLYSNAIIWVILDFTVYFISAVEPRMFFKFWPVPGIAYSLYLALWIFQALVASLLLLKGYLSSVGIQKIQHLLMLAGLCLAFLGGATNYLLWYKINIAPWGNILVVLMPISIGYAILRYRFLDIKVFIKKNVFYIFICLLLFAIYWLAVGAFRYLGSPDNILPQLSFDWTEIRYWYFPISALINALASISLGLFLLFKDFKSKVNRLFFTFCLSVAVWSGCYFIWQLSATYESALFWSRGLMFGATWAPLFYFHLVSSYFSLDNKRFYKMFLLISYCFAGIWSILDFTPYVVSSVEPILFFRSFPMAGVGLKFFLIYFIVLVLVTIYLLAISYFYSDGIKQKQIKFLLAGTALGYLGGSTNFFLMYKIPIIPYGNILVALYVVLTAYAILRYRFLNIVLFIRKWLFYLILGLAIVGIYTFSAGFLKVLNISSAVAQYGLAGMVAAMVSVFFFPRLERFFTENKLFFKNQYDHSDALRDSSKAISSTIDFNYLMEEIFAILKKLLDINSAAGVLFDTNGHSGQIISLKTFGFSYEFGNITAEYRWQILEFFTNQREPILLPELPRRIIESSVDSGAHQQLIKIMEFLKKAGAEAILPIYSKSKLVSLLVLGPKAEKDIYNVQDVEFLAALSDQLSVALENIKSYQKIKNHSQELQREVEVATRELRALNERQSKFMADIAHELQSPVAIVKGNLELIETRGCEQSLISNSLLSTNRLSGLIKNLLFLARADFNQLEIKKERVNLSEVLRLVYDETRVFAEEKKVDYQLDQPAEIFVEADIDKIKSVFLNILSNAFKYVTPGGQVKIISRQKDNKILITFFNSGSAIPEKDLPHIFERFYRRQDGDAKGKQGTGLGLSIAKTIVDGHGGKIWVENRIEGVEFGVEL